MSEPNGLLCCGDRPLTLNLFQIVDMSLLTDSSFSPGNFGLRNREVQGMRSVQPPHAGKSRSHGTGCTHSAYAAKIKSGGYRYRKRVVLSAAEQIKIHHAHISDTAADIRVYSGDIV